MNKKLFTIALGLMFLGTALFSQTIQNSVISNAGTTATAGGVRIDYTLGETVVETFSAGGNTLTQGFHQTNLTITAIENVELFAEISIYPNPSKDFVNIDIPADYDLLDITLYDVLGSLINKQTEVSGSVTLDVTNISVGTYYLQVINPINRELKTFKLVKSN
ncbi:MAG: T9SS type A sorting domain-containing protein [Bacteroidales bacterium]|nr:T9SS type A sorting domain-containing protein [Bacteroidales bacterium]